MFYQIFTYSYYYVLIQIRLLPDICILLSDFVNFFLKIRSLFLLTWSSVALTTMEAEKSDPRNEVGKVSVCKTLNKNLKFEFLPWTSGLENWLKSGGKTACWLEAFQLS